MTPSSRVRTSSDHPRAASPPAARRALLQRYRAVRSQTERLVAPLTPEDMVIQPEEDVSPTKWHLAHVTWFFETFVLCAGADPPPRFDDRYHELFNSYYRAVGEPYPRHRRGLQSRPRVEDVLAYRLHVDREIERWCERAGEDDWASLAPRLALGLVHEEQHQELLLMDAKAVLALNRLKTSYRERAHEPVQSTPLRWTHVAGGRVTIGNDAPPPVLDNERPRHAVLLQDYALANRLVTVAEYLEFIADDGYARPELWLSDGFEVARRERWSAPAYWRRVEDQPAGAPEGWSVDTLTGRRAPDPDEPVCHVSYYEADAYARWRGCRLPTEAEWEHAARDADSDGTFLESGALHPRGPLQPPDRLGQLLGDAWEWTQSPYVPYPGYERFAGELGEYNGKFMVNQQVLRGGCCVTPAGHVRTTYRHFF